MTLPEPLRRPWRLPPNRVGRFYTGGLLLDRFRGNAAPADGDRPEDWVGSATRAWTPPSTPPSEDGLGDAEIEGERHRIADLLRVHPAAVAGPASQAPGSPTVGVLVKLLDSAVRLPVHCHPSRSFARRHLGSFFGKAEAWLIQETRDPDGADIWLGFRRDVGRDELLAMIEGGDTEALLDAMHRRRARAGDTWFVPPGVPHAIGAGVFMVEVQEPSDFSVVAELRDVPIDAADAHLGLGWDVTLDAFDREGHDDRWVDGLRRDTVDTPFFGALPLLVEGRATPELGPGYLVGVVTGGDGRIRAGSGDITVRRGDTFAVPAAAVPTLVLEADARLELIACQGVMEES
jgi:mannose-6-phosphate isomerase